MNTRTRIIAAVAFSSVAALPALGQLSTGPDVVYTNISGISQYGPVGSYYAYALGTHTCNMGNVNLRWGSTWAGSPIVAMNAYRLKDGRLTQIGLGFAKRACCAAAGSGCGVACNGAGGSVLGSGCRDVYSSGYNGSFSQLGPRSGINAYTGAINSPGGGSGDAIFKRLQVHTNDMNAAMNPGALYFVEGVYVASDDAPAVGANSNNNASYKRVTISGSYAMTEQGTMAIGVPAIYAWRDHGLGVGVPDPAVTITPIDIPGEGRLIVAHKVTNLSPARARYDYAVYNLSSDKSAGAFSVPLPRGLVPENIGYNGVRWHSGEPYDNSPWTATVTGSAITWSTPQPFAQNPNSGAVRWGTMHNFWFEAPPPSTISSANATIGIFKPHTPQTVQVAVVAPDAVPCAADYNGDGELNSADFFDFLADFFAGCSN